MITLDSLLMELEASGYAAPRPEGPEVVRAWNDRKLPEVMMLGLIALMLRKLRDGPLLMGTSKANENAPWYGADMSEA